MIDLEEQYKAIDEIINNHTCVVTQDMLDFFNKKFNNGNSAYSSLLNTQAEALEWSLEQVGLAKRLPPVEGEKYAFRHDWAYSLQLLIDLKRRQKKYKNITISNLIQKEQSFKMGQLTHFKAYTQNIDDRLLTIGDKLSFEAGLILPFEVAKAAAFKLNPNDRYDLIRVI
jgi:hypothetical protein